MGSRRAFRPLETGGRRAALLAILVTFGVFSALNLTLSVRATSRSQSRATVVEIAARQRTLAERYVNDLILVHEGQIADPTSTAHLLTDSAVVLLDGGVAPEVPGDEDETVVPATTGTVERRQLEQSRRLIADLTATGSTWLAGGPVTEVPLTAHEHIEATDPITRLRALGALVSSVSLNAARTIAANTDRNVNGLVMTQVALGIVGFVTSLLLAVALLATTRRQTAHFRSLVTSSTDLVLVFGPGGCRYASQSVATMLGRSPTELLGDGLLDAVHGDDRGQVRATSLHGEPHQLVFRLIDRFGEPRWVEAHVTDLRRDRQVRGLVFNARDITERVRLEEQLTRQAFHDGLTGLANRALFRDRLDQALARSARTRDRLAVLLADLDGFKAINDSLGHDAGDELLRDVARRFATVMRPSDTLARLGGDEFVVLLEGADEERALAVAHRLLDRLAEPISLAGRQLVVGSSIGVVLHPGGPGDSDELIRHADVAMYEAKENGRGRCEVFRYDMARELGEMLGLEHELRRGLEQGEVTVHYQPEIDLLSGAVVGVEALARWTSPTRGSVPPARFIPVAEDTGLIISLGEFVLEAACRQTVEWRRAGVLPEPFVTWVNVSGRQLSAGGVSETVRRALAVSGLPPDHLGLEVTETAIVVGGAAGEIARRELEDLHDLGVKVAIDDFGTGFSSLGQLRRFPIDVIKIDGSFVQGAEHDTKSAAITANIVNLAQLLGLSTIAEGIESDSQLASVRRLGCDHAQGFLFAHPVPGDQLTEVFAERHSTVPVGG